MYQQCYDGGGVLLQDAGGQGVGFLLGSLSVRVALTSEACFKGLPKTPAGLLLLLYAMSSDRVKLQLCHQQARS